MAETCGTCRYHLGRQSDGTGECHGAPPSVLRYFSVRGMVTLPLWPVTPGSAWCGHYAPAPSPARLQMHE